MSVYVPLAGSARNLLPNSRPAGPIDPSEIDSITVRVRSAGDPQALEKRAYELAMDCRCCFRTIRSRPPSSPSS